jgi:hypothetical protein
VAEFREGCGTFLGLKLHQANGERPCSECLHAEDVRRLEHEGIPQRIPAAGRFDPVTPREAERNRAILAEALKDIERGRRDAAA